MTKIAGIVLALALLAGVAVAQPTITSNPATPLPTGVVGLTYPGFTFQGIGTPQPALFPELQRQRVRRRYTASV